MSDKNDKDIFDLRLEMRIKNNILYHAIYERFGSPSELLRAHPDVKMDDAYGFLSLRRSPFKKNGDYRVTARRLAKALGLEINKLFPAYLYEDIKEPSITLEMASSTGRIRSVEQLKLPAHAVQLLHDKENWRLQTLAEEISMLLPKDQPIARDVFTTNPITGRGPYLTTVAKKHACTLRRVKEIKNNINRRILQRARELRGRVVNG